MARNPGRREFLKKSVIGAVAICGLSGWSRLALAAVGRTKKMPLGNPPETGAWTELSGWEIHFDESNSSLSFRNGGIILKGELVFSANGERWSTADSRDGVSGRYALVDPKGDVQGYFRCLTNGNRVQLIFYHRTAQSFKGDFSFTGEIVFPADGFPCRTQPRIGERVLALSTGSCNSSRNDSLFSPANDLVLQLRSPATNLTSKGAGTYAFSVRGRIEEAAEAVFDFTAVADYFRRSYAPYYEPIDRKRFSKVPTGWMSWNTYFDKASAADNLNEARIGARYLLPFGCAYWSIESWQGNSDQLPVSDFYNMNLEVNQKQFPEGMKKLADDIRAFGFRPGIWMAPFGTGNRDFYLSHKRWFLHDKAGNPIRSWNGQYTLDPTVEEAREHLKNIFRVASRDWGYEFFKVDGMSGRNSGYCAHLYERPEVRDCFRDPACPNPFELCVKTIREGIGDDKFFLACQGHSSGPESRYADASRLGADIVHPNEPVKWENVLNQGRCFLNQAFTHQITMIADPDTLLVHDLPQEEARVSATIVALPGQLTFFGDKLAGLSKDRMKILQQTLPVADVRPVSLYPYFSMLPVWNLQVDHKQIGSYNVVALFNWEDVPRTIETTFEELGIDPTAEYTAYEFWTEKSVPLNAGQPSLSVDVPAHGVRLVTLHRLQSRPQWISSDRHIAQNAMEISQYKWEESNHTLEGKIRLTGGFPLTMRLKVPDHYAYRRIGCDHAECRVQEESDHILAVRFLSKKSSTASFRMKFI